MLQFRARGSRATPIATSRQQWRHRLDTSKLANVLAVLVVVVMMLGVLLPGLVPPLWQIIANEARLLAAAFRAEGGVVSIGPRAASVVTVVTVFLLLTFPLILYIRFIVAAIDVHGRRQSRRMAGAWAKGIRSLSSSPLSRASAKANLVGSVVMVAGVFGIVLLTVPIDQARPIFSLYPIPTVVVCAAVLGGTLIWIAEELRLVYWTARSVGTLLPRTRSVVPSTRVSLWCPVCHDDVLSRSGIVRITKDASRAGQKMLRTSDSHFLRALRWVESFLKRDPLKIVMLAVIILPAALGLSVEVYMMVLVTATVMILLYDVFTSHIGMLVFAFPGGDSVGPVLRTLGAAFGLLLNCLLVIRIIDWGEVAFSGRGWQFDENYAALFLLSSEAVAIVVILALLGYHLRGTRQMRPAEVLGRSALPLVTLFLAAVVAPWAATFAAFLIGLDFGKRGPAS